MEAALAGDYSGPMPAEYQDWLLVRETGWSWQQLQAAPLYVRRCFTGFALAEATARAREAAKAATARDPHAQAAQAADADRLIEQARADLGLPPTDET